MLIPYLDFSNLRVHLPTPEKTRRNHVTWLKCTTVGDSEQIIQLEINFTYM